MSRTFGKPNIQRAKKGLSKVNPLIHRQKSLTHKVASNPLKRAIDSGELPESKRQLIAA
jgi:hypothetical protein